MKKVFTAVLSACIFGIPVVSAASLPAKLQAALLIKILSEDSSIPKQAKGTVKIGILGGNFSDFQSEFNQMKEKGVKIQGLDFDTKQISSSAEEIKTVNVVLLLTDGNLTAVTAATQAAKTLSVAGADSAESMVKNGASVGLALDGGKPKLLVNITSLSKEGHELTPSILQLCTILK